jgi:transcriptional regulator with GAF, ATPase, and Fis domain
LAPGLIASELFGHEKGSFTGAVQRRLGRFELAHGGTIFLDEVGELPLDTQVALLRVLQERVIVRVGGTQPIAVNVRVLTATNRDLQATVASGAFRADLFYRLNVFPIEVPALRDRREDIPALVRHFVQVHAKELGKKISSIDQETMRMLQAYQWPGNIRELQNIVERSLILSEGETLSVDAAWLNVNTPHDTSGSLLQKLVEREREIVESALAESNGKVSGAKGAASRLGIPPTTLESRIKALGINKNRFK